MEETAGDQSLHGAALQTHALGDARSNPGDAVIVGAGIRIALGDGTPQRLHHRNVRVEHLARLALVVCGEVDHHGIDRRAA